MLSEFPCGIAEKTEEAVAPLREEAERIAVEVSVVAEARVAAVGVEEGLMDALWFVRMAALGELALLAM